MKGLRAFACCLVTRSLQLLADGGADGKLWLLAEHDGGIMDVNPDSSDWP
jgi:hypothetical protein